tara:strand:- start:1961 stop:2374 length:414 start_codon:yes stop_codon:yes gene_type:complete
MAKIVRDWLYSKMMRIAQLQRQINDLPDGEEKDKLLAEVENVKSQTIETLKDPASRAWDWLGDEKDEFIGEIGDLSLAFVRGFAGAFIEGLENAYDLVASKLSGREPEIIASITAGVLVILVSVFLWGEVRRGPKGG